MKLSNGFLHWVFPAMVGLVALTALMSGRDLSRQYLDLAAGTVFSHPVVVWGQRCVSLLLMAAAAERIISHFGQRKALPSPILMWAFVGYWIATVAVPAVFGTHPQLAHEYVYTLSIGLAAVLCTASERDRIFDASRNALFLFLLAGVLLIPVMPSLVMDMTYKQGLLPGVPRHGGLAPHPVALGMFAQIGLLLLWARPFSRKWVNRLAWLLGASVLFLAQSKTAWIAFILCSACMLAVRQGPVLWRRMGDPRQGAFGVVVCLFVMIAAIGMMAVVLLGNVEGQLGDFFDSAQGAQLMSMTGRDQIWAIAIEEWQANRLFGYGPNLWNDDFRASIGMPNATNAHNQFMDTLSRSGGIGAAALVLYALVLLVLSIRHTGATGGLSLALFVAVALRSVSEVPLQLFGYGTELFTHLLLLVLLASTGAERVKAATYRSRSYRTVS